MFECGELHVSILANRDSYGSHVPATMLAAYVTDVVGRTVISRGRVRWSLTLVHAA